MFDTDQFIEDCICAREEDDSHKAVRQVVERAVQDPAAVMNALGEPNEAGFHALYQNDKLTIISFTWAPMMTLMPHNHNMWAVIGLYSGREDNIFWRQKDGHLEAAGAKALMPGAAAALGRDVIHSVTNPIGKMTSALHVYGGDFFAPGRSEWDPETLEKSPFDFDKSRRIFKEANARMGKP